MKYSPHHTAISVRNLEDTLRFYEVFGFKQVHRYDDEDKIGVKIKLDNYVIEIFAYNKNKQKAPLELDIGNNLASVGVKHIGFSVEDIEAALKELISNGLANPQTKMLSKGKAKFFFVQDPDGMWVEVIKDDRY